MTQNKFGQSLYSNPEFCLVVFSDTEACVYHGDTHQIELIERNEFSHINGPQQHYGQTSIVTPAQRRGLKYLAMGLNQSARFARMPVVVTGAKEFLAYFMQNFQHDFGVVKHEGPHYAHLTCPELLREIIQYKHSVINLYAENFKLRLKSLERSGRVLTNLTEINEAVNAEKVQQLWIAEECAINFEMNYQVLPRIFFPQGALALGILRGEAYAHSPLSRMASHNW